MTLSNLDPRPVCNRRHGRMRPDSLASDNIYCCSEPGCNVHYDSARGYFEPVLGQIAVHGSQRHCPRDGSPMYLAGFGGQPGCELWCCAQPGCCLRETIHLELEPFPSDELIGE